MMRTFVKTLASAVIAVLLSSCAVHEWPETLPADATLKLDFNTALPQFIVIEHDTRSSKDGKDYEIRYIVEAYRQLGEGSFSTTPYKRFIFTKSDVSDLNNEVTVNIDEGTYDFYVWTDFTEKEARKISSTTPEVSGKSSSRASTKATTTSATHLSGIRS